MVSGDTHPLAFKFVGNLHVPRFNAVQKATDRPLRVMERGEEPRRRHYGVELCRRRRSHWHRVAVVTGSWPEPKAEQHAPVEEDNTT